MLMLIKLILIIMSIGFVTMFLIPFVIEKLLNWEAKGWRKK